MPSAANYPSIPVPGPNVAELQNAFLIMKQCVELLMGVSNMNLAPTRCYVQATAPVDMREGDFWVVPSETALLNVYIGKGWVPLTKKDTSGDYLERAGAGNK